MPVLLAMSVVVLALLAGGGASVARADTVRVAASVVQVNEENGTPSVKGWHDCRSDVFLQFSAVAGVDTYHGEVDDTYYGKRTFDSGQDFYYDSSGYYTTQPAPAGTHRWLLTGGAGQGPNPCSPFNDLTGRFSNPVVTYQGTARPPAASFTYKPTGASTRARGESYRFQSTSTDPQGQPLTLRWDFGDGATDDSEAPFHNFQPGTYTVTLTATNTSGKSDSATAEITVGYKVSGTVKDEDDKPVAGVTIRADQDGSRVASGTSDATGAYSLRLPSGQTHFTADEAEVCAVVADGKCENARDIDVVHDTTIDWTRKNCVTTVTFGSLAAINGCFKKTGDLKWETDKPFRMDGIDVAPRGTVTFDGKTGQVAFQAAGWSLAGVTAFLFDSPFVLDFNAPTQSIKALGAVPVGKIFGVKLADLGSLTFAPGSTTIGMNLDWTRDLRRPQGAIIGPQPAGACSGSVKVALTLQATNDKGLAQSTVEAKPSETLCVMQDSAVPDNPAAPSGIQLTSVKGGYDFATGYWLLGGKVEGVPLFGGRASLTASMTFATAPFRVRGVSVLVDGINKPVYGPLLIQRGGFAAAVESDTGPFSLTLNAGFSIGPHVNTPVVKTIPIVGSFTVLPSELVSIDPALTYADKDKNAYTLDDASFAGSGVVKFWDYALLNGSIAYLPGPSAITLDGRLGFSDSSGQYININGTATGFVDPSRGLLFLDGRGVVSLPFLRLPRASAEVIVNSDTKILAACLLNGNDPSYGFLLHVDTFKSAIGGCDLGPYRATPPVQGAIGTSAAAGGGKAFRVPPKTKLLVVRVPGSAGRAPHVVVTGPGFRLAANPRGGGASGRSRIYAMPDGTTYVALVRPRAGRWRVAPQPGSAVRSLTFAGVAPKPQVRAKLTGSSCTPRLSWKIRRQPLQVVRFVDRGKDGSVRVVKTAAPPSGQLTIKARGDGRRTIQAQVLQGGALRTTIKVGSYRAVSTRVGPPTHITVRAQGHKVRVSWRRPCGAKRFVVSAGKAPATNVSKTSVVVSSAPGTVRVTSVAANGGPGGSATAALKAKRP